MGGGEQSTEEETQYFRIPKHFLDSSIPRFGPSSTVGPPILVPDTST